MTVAEDTLSTLFNEADQETEVRFIDHDSGHQLFYRSRYKSNTRPLTADVHMTLLGSWSHGLDGMEKSNTTVRQWNHILRNDYGVMVDGAFYFTKRATLGRKPIRILSVELDESGPEPIIYVHAQTLDDSQAGPSMVTGIRDRIEYPQDSQVR